MEALLEKIKDVVVDFVRWFWNGLNPPDRKDWCAIFYFVAQEDAGLGYPETSLDIKLEATIDVLKSASFDDAKMHVVYRAVWADTGRDPVAAVISPSKLPPETEYFPGCSVSTSPPLDTGKDLTCFLKWAYKWCPADHYAIFFWGHSFGPAGLFEPGGTFGIPRPTGLASLREAFEQFSAQRQGSPPTSSTVSPPLTEGRVAAPVPSPAGGGTTGDERIDAWATAQPKVEVVLFQDCWMSTFETAYELADVATYVIASQSLLPIGTDYADFVWPYEQLLADLLTANFQENLTTHVGDFYESNFSEIATLVTVHIALLDLGGVNGMTGPLKDLAKALKKVLTLDQRGLLIEQGQIVAFDQNGDLSAGDTALMDVQKMCVQMQAHPNPDISDAATSVLAGLAAVIKVTREAVPPGTQPTGFSGISVLYRPPPPRLLDDYITQAIHKASYLNLEFSKKTAWPATEQKRQT